MNGSVLVTGGCGYVGSCVVRALLERGERVVVVDDLSTGHRDAIPEDVPFLNPREDVGIGFVEELAFLRGLGPEPVPFLDFLREHEVTRVIHLAGRSQTGESVKEPRLYYRENVVGSVRLLESILDAGVRKIVFSSSAAVYGNPVRVPIPEGHPLRPVSPYGETKLAVERMLECYETAYDLEYVALRYFNAAGAWPEADARYPNGLGERHDPETHLVPRVLDVALGRVPSLYLSGHDYETPDGTCIRDYVHVRDLADAHLLALDHLETDGLHGAFNLGTGRGYSVWEVVEAARRITSAAIPVAHAPRRPGDPPVLVADPTRAITTLGWSPERSTLDRIIEDAWAWTRQRNEI